jgi:hemerythrin
MPFMEWNPSFSVGVDELDSDHKILIALLNDLYDAVEEGKGLEAVEQTLDGLVVYVSNHFRYEEGLFLHAQYPDYASHKKTHDRLAAEVMDIQTKFKAGPDKTFPHEVLEFLKEWLCQHILVSDKKFGAFLSASET